MCLHVKLHVYWLSCVFRRRHCYIVCVTVWSGIADLHKHPYTASIWRAQIACVIRHVCHSSRALIYGTNTSLKWRPISHLNSEIISHYTKYTILYASNSKSDQWMLCREMTEFILRIVDRNNVADITIRYGLDGPRSSPGVQDIFCVLPDYLWGSHSLL